VGDSLIEATKGLDKYNFLYFITNSILTCRNNV